MNDNRLLTVREASEQLGLRESTLRKWVLQKRIAYCKLGRSVRLPAEVVAKLIRESYREAIAEGGIGRWHLPQRVTCPVILPSSTPSSASISLIRSCRSFSVRLVSAWISVHIAIQMRHSRSRRSSRPGELLP